MVQSSGQGDRVPPQPPATRGSAQGWVAEQMRRASLVEGEKIARTVGLGCPACGGRLKLGEGTTVERCPFCGITLLLHVPGNVPRYTAVRRLDEGEAWHVVRRWLRVQLPWPFRWARKQDALLVYAPFWLATGRAVGLFANGKRRLLDRRISWAQPAYDLSELTVQGIRPTGDELVPLDRDALLRDGMVLQDSVPQVEGLRRAVDRMLYTAQGTSTLARLCQADLVERRFALLFHPMWLIRFRYWGRYYQAVVDGTEPRMMAGQVSDRMPKLILLISALGLMGSFFGIWGFIVAGILAAIFSPRLTRVDESTPRAVAGPPRGGEAKSLWEGHTPWDDTGWNGTQDTWLITLRCPTCDRPLAGKSDAVLFYCEECRQGVECREGALRPVEVKFVKAQAGRDVPQPWWVLTVRGQGWDRRKDRRLPDPGKKPMDIYVPAYALSLPECIAEGVDLTRRQPVLWDAGIGRWQTCTVSGTDAMRLAELIYLSLDEDEERFERSLELVAMRLVVFVCD